MGLFDNLFGKSAKISNVEVFKEYATTILELANVSKSDANKVKVITYLCFAQLACMDTLTKGKSRPFMDAMVKDATLSTKGLRLRIGELAHEEKELNRILNDFPKEASLDKHTIIEGTAGFNAIYFQFVEEIVPAIAKHTGGPMGVHGYAAIVVLEALRGKGNGKDGIIEVSFAIAEMGKAVIKSFR